MNKQSCHPAAVPLTRRIALGLNIRDEYGRAILRGIEAGRDALAAAGPPEHRDLWQFRNYDCGFPDKLWRNQIADWQPEGFIAEIWSHATADFFKAMGVPGVELLHQPRKVPQWSFVGLDDRAIGHMAADHFLDCGLRNFGFIGLTASYWSQLRGEGFAAAIQKHFSPAAGASATKDYTHSIYNCPFAKVPGVLPPEKQLRRHAAIADWVATLPKPVGVFAANDLWAVALQQIATDAHIRVPEDLAVLGVDDDHLLCNLATPHLSSILTAHTAVGRKAFDALVERLIPRAGGRRLVAEATLLPPVEVIARRSTDIAIVADSDIAKALTIMRAKAQVGLSIRELMNDLPVNRRSFEIKFRRVVGRTPLAEINRVRMERIKNRLRADDSMQQIARVMGYRSPQYMATAFKRITGITPTEYRRQIMGGR